MYCIRKHLAIVIARGRMVGTPGERWIWMELSHVMGKRKKTRAQLRGLTLSHNAAGYHSSPGPWLRHKEKDAKKPLKHRVFRKKKVQISAINHIS